MTGKLDKISRIDQLTRTYYWAVVIIIVLVSISVAGTVIIRDYYSRLDDGSQKAMGLAQAVAEHATQTIVRLEALSKAIIEDRNERIVDDRLLSEVLRRRAAAEPAATAIVLVGAVGRIEASGIDALPPGADLSATTEFQQMSDLRTPDEFLSAPQKTARRGPEDSRSWTFNYARRIVGEDKQFAGYVLIIVDQSYIYGFLGDLSDRPEQILGLIGKDGQIKAASDERAIGRNVTFRLDLERRQQSIVGPSILSGEELVVAYYRTAAGNLMAYAGFPTRPIFTSWLITSTIIIAALAGLIATLITLGSILAKYTIARSLLLDNMIAAAKQSQEKEFLETIIQTNVVAIAVTDPTGNIVATNNSLSSLFPDIEKVGREGVSRMIGEPLDKITPELPWQGVRHVAVGNGEKRALSWVVSPIYSENGSLKNLVIVGLDITERREAELAIYQSAKLVTLGQMATGIAHEINQPLATILLTLDNLQDDIASGVTDAQKLGQAVKTAISQAERASTIIQHMRIYGRKSDGELREIDLTAAVDGALAIASAQMSDDGIELRRSYLSGSTEVCGDTLLIEQIVLNILMNARDAIHDRRERDRTRADVIVISIEQHGADHFAVSIADSGSGFSDDLKDRLFDPFFTTKPVGQGTGLGLALSYGMARDMGGNIIAETSAEGATFRLILRKSEQTEANNERYC